jgi:GAF domain-containing protein
MVPSVTAAQSLLSAEERAAIAEIEATTSILHLVCSVYDPLQMGINVHDVLDLETTLCSEFCINPQALFIPEISKNGRFAARPVVKQFEIESYAGAPIFLPDGRLYGALCALDSRAMLFEDPNLPETLSLFARLIGCIFYANLTSDQ